MNENVTKFFKATYNLVATLAERWLDESQYEDIKEYQDRLQTEATGFGITLKKMSKKPFGCFFDYEGREYFLVAKFKGSKISIEILCKAIKP